MSTYGWLRGPLLGAALGLPILGGGGRLAMRLIALYTDAASAVSVEGTITVLLSGLGAGSAGGVIYTVLDRLMPHRRLARGALFATALILLTLRGLRPVQPLPLALFLPIVLLYGALFEHLWHARRQRSHILEPTA